jgi:hypothetical protein
MSDSVFGQGFHSVRGELTLPALHVEMCMAQHLSLLDLGRSRSAALALLADGMTSPQRCAFGNLFNQEVPMTEETMSRLIRCSVDAYV